MGWRRGSGGCFLSRRRGNYQVTRLKLVRGKAFPGSSDHGEAAEPRRRAGGSAAWLELLLLPRFCRLGFAQTGSKAGPFSGRKWDSIEWWHLCPQPFAGLRSVVS